MSLSDIKTIIIEPKCEITSLLWRLPTDLKSWIDGKASELNYTTTEYLTLVMTQISEQDDE